MIESNKLEQIGTQAVKRLRVNKLKHGVPFMINVRTLPGSQCYLEYPSGKIVLVTYSSSSRDFVVLRELTADESSELRSKLDLELVPA